MKLRVLSVSMLILMLVSCGGDDNGKFSISEDIQIKASPNSITFGTVALFEEVVNEIYLTHIGTEGLLKIGKIFLKEGGSADFTLIQPEKTELAKDESAILSVKYRPSDSTADNGSIIVENNSTNAPVLVIPLSSLTQIGSLVAIPDPVNFGEVPQGEEKSIEARILNVGADKITVSKVYLKNEEESDFSFATETHFPVEIEPKGEIKLNVTFKPDGEIFAQNFIVIENDSKGAPVYELELLGVKLAPEIVITPGMIDFEWVLLNEKKSLPVTIHNAGTMDLKIDSVTLTLNGNTFVSLENAPLSGALIQPDTEVNFNALFEPVEVFQPTGMPIATIEVKSNDADSNPALVHIFGKVGYPDLKVTPPETVDFGFVAKNMIVTRDVNLYNSGGAPLKIYGIYLEGALTNEFAIEKDENFPPLSSAPGEGEIAGGEFYVMKVAFTNLQGESGTEKAQLKILSNDLDNPEIVLDLIAKRTDSPECKVAFQPEKMNFGTVSYGYSKIMTVNLVNAGGGNCTIKQAHIDDCISLMGISQCAVNGKPGSIKSKNFQILNMPLPTPEGFKPGDSYPVQIRFIPPDNVKLMLPGEFMSFSSLFTVTMEDPYSKQTFNYPYVGIPNDPNNPPVSPNILAKAGQSYIIGIPNELDFGLITIGCSSQTMTVKVYNIGEKPENVSSVELVGCTPEFKIVGYPALPALVTLGNSVNVEVKYTPQDKGNDGCSLLIKTTDPGTPELTVPLKGAGTFDSEQTDTFKQVSGQEVDVLFAVDCSGSMGDDQKNLADNFDYFISKASKWNNDYHIGVVSCDFDEENGMRGKLMGSPRFVTPQNWQDFKKNVKLGDMCSATEQGLISSQAALSFPLAHDTDIACQNNSPCTEPDKCVDGFCGGYNRGFLRKDARLEVIVVSDEEDQSPAALSFYIDFFKSIKGWANVGMFHLHAIVGTEEKLCAAEVGKRYIDAATELGGKVVDICAPDWAMTLEDLGNIAFGLKVQFFLTRIADPPTVEVSINGNKCSEGWSFDAASNSVIFDEKGKCMPQPGDEIKIHYETLCL